MRSEFPARSFHSWNLIQTWFRRRSTSHVRWATFFIELDDGKIYRKPLYLMVKTMVSCRFSLKPIHWILGDIGSFQAVWCPGEAEAPPWWVSHGGGFPPRMFGKYQVEHILVLQKGIVYIYIYIYIYGWGSDFLTYIYDHICNIIYMYTRFLWHKMISGQIISDLNL